MTVRSANAWSDTVVAAKQALILDAARQVFSERGLEGATMREIAARAGVTTGAIYPQFASKEALYAELLSRSLEALALAVSQASAAPRRGEAAHEAAARAFLVYYLAHPFEVNLGLYAFHGLKRQGLGHPLDDRLNESLSATVKLLSPGAARTVGMPDTRAMLAFSQLIGLLTLELAGRLKIGRTTPHKLLDAFLRDRKPNTKGDEP